MSDFPFEAQAVSCRLDHEIVLSAAQSDGLLAPQVVVRERLIGSGSRPSSAYLGPKRRKDSAMAINGDYTLWAWAYNDNGRSGTASVDCDTISDTWVNADCSGAGIIRVRWDDPSGTQTAPSGYTGAIILAANLLDGQVASYDEAYDSNNTSVEWGAIGSPNSEYQVHVQTKNANGGPVYSQTKNVVCPPLAAPDYSGPNVPQNLSWWQKGLILLGAVDGSPRVLSPSAASLLYFEGADYILNQVSRSCNSESDEFTGVTTQTCDEVWNEYITVRLDESSFDETAAKVVDANVPDDEAGIVGRTFSLRLLWGKIKKQGAKKIAAKILLRSGAGIALETYVIWVYYEGTAPYAQINGKDNCIFDQPKNRGNDIRDWTATNVSVSATETVGKIKSVRNATVSYCKEVP